MYKYSPVNTYSLKNLEHCQIWCNHYQAFNDPFECWCIVNSGIPDPNVDEDRFFKVIKVWGFDKQDKELALEDYYEYLQHFEEDEIDVKYMVNSARISCFSQEQENLLMWAHYANGLRGFCIEFDFKNAMDNAHIIPVQYLKKPPVLETITYPLANDIYWHSEEEHSEEARGYMKDFHMKMLGSKPIEWNYEKESRLIFHSQTKGTAGEVSYKHKTLPTH
jgi:hypothetical protein